jgi:hypothetical protein
MLAIGCRMLPLALQAAAVTPRRIELSLVAMPTKGICILSIVAGLNKARIVEE